MARFNASQVDNYGGNGGGGFFRLSNDGDVATVRFMYDSIDDVVGESVHEIKVMGDDGKEKKKYISCLRDYKDPVSVCPCCAAGMPVQAKLFIPLYDVTSGTTKTWERGKKFFGKMSSLCSRYSNEDTPLVAHTFEIERHGAAGDTSTFYEIYETGSDDTIIEDLPDFPILDNYLLDYTAEQMQDYLDNKDKDNAPTEMPVRRRERGNDATGGRRRREAF